MSAPTMQTYEVRTLRDLLAIPNEKLDACLVDLAIWVRLLKSAEALGLKVKEAAGPGSGPDVFGWLDDGRHVASVTIGGKVSSVDLTEPAPAWIRFDRQPQLETGKKTHVWAVLTKDAEGVLGLVKWFGRWRRYAFFPAPETVFEPTCLGDIAAFIAARMAERRAARRIA